jgi:CHAD domain-containing protein
MILEAGQAEGVHQMRVALRRMRAALSIFGGDLPSEKMNRVKQSLRGILEVLGPARDWDVLVATRLAAPGGSGAAGLVQAEVHRLAERERGIAWNRVCEFLKSRSFSRTLLELTGWISCRRWREGLSAKELRRFHRPVKAMALRTLRRGHQRLLQAGAGLAEAEDAAWHRVRIAMKRQRYFMESFRTCFPSKPVGRYVDALEELQDAFGALQDLAAGGVLLGEMAARHPGAVAVFVQGMLLAQERERNCLRTSALRRWPGFSELKCPWHDRG